LDALLPDHEELANPDEADTLEEVERYRSLFAEILVLGSAIQDIDGDERALFERRPVQVRTKVAEEMHENVDNSPREADSLRGLTRILYRQHARKLHKAYTVA